MKETELMLASALNNLTAQERTLALHDVHCVGEELKESPEIVEKSLVEFDQAVQRQRNPVYDIAVSHNRAYVENRSFRLRFLRAAMHNIGLAVANMMNFLDNKLLHFGEDKVSREIRLNDLNEEEVGLLVSGIFHIQNDRDPMGRVIVYITAGIEMLEICRAQTLVRLNRCFPDRNLLDENPGEQLTIHIGFCHVDTCRILFLFQHLEPDGSRTNEGHSLYHVRRVGTGEAVCDTWTQRWADDKCCYHVLSCPLLCTAHLCKDREYKYGYSRYPYCGSG